MHTVMKQRDKVHASKWTYLEKPSQTLQMRIGGYNKAVFPAVHHRRERLQ